VRHLLNQLCLMLSAVFLVSCASAIPPARIGDYVSSEHRAGGAAFTRINQRPLQAVLASGRTSSASSRRQCRTGSYQLRNSLA